MNKQSREATVVCNKSRLILGEDPLCTCSSLRKLRRPNWPDWFRSWPEPASVELSVLGWQGYKGGGMTNGSIIRKKPIYLLRSCQLTGTWRRIRVENVGASCNFDATSVEFLVKLPNIWLCLNACLLRCNSQRDSNLRCEIGEGGKQFFGSNFIVAPGDAGRYSLVAPWPLFPAERTSAPPPCAYLSSLEIVFSSPAPPVTTTRLAVA